MKKAISLLLVVVICLSLVACGKSEAVKAAEEAIAAIGEVTAYSGEAIANAEKYYNILTDAEKAEVENRMVLVDAKEAFEEVRGKIVYNNAKAAYEKLKEVAELCISGMDDIYNAWHFGLYSADDCTTSNIYTELANETSFSSSELQEAAAQLGGFSAKTMAALLVNDWQYCVLTVKEAITMRGDYDTITAHMANAEKILQTLTKEFDDYTYYPKLKDYYASVKSYVEFFTNPTGSFNQLVDTINNYENGIRTLESDVSFLFNK